VTQQTTSHASASARVPTAHPSSAASASIELKQFDPTGASARALASGLRKAGVPLSKVIVQSFFPPNLDAAHTAMPGVATSTLTLQQAQATSIQAAVDAGSVWVSPQFPVDAAYVEAAHAAGRKVAAWTLDRADEVRAAQAAGVDALITDDPYMARRVLR
jgi:glycerophosphoryl diester phosphodiesterase